MYDFLVSLMEMSEYLPLFILFIFTGLRYELIFLPLLDLLILKAAVVVLSKTIIFIYHEQAILNCFIQNTYAILYFFIVSRLYKSILGERFSNYFQIVNIIFLIAFILSSIWFDFRYDFFNYSVSTENLVFSIYGILYFQSIRNNFVTKEFNNFFWLNLAFLTYNVCMFPAMFFDRIIIIGDSWTDIQKILWSIVLFSSILNNVFLSIFLYESRLKKEDQIVKQ